MESTIDWKEHLRKAMADCSTNDIPELVKLSDELREVLIELVAILRKNGMKGKLKRTWTELISE